MSDGPLGSGIHRAHRHYQRGLTSSRIGALVLLTAT